MRPAGSMSSDQLTKVLLDRTRAADLARLEDDHDEVIKAVEDVYDLLDEIRAVKFEELFESGLTICHEGVMLEFFPAIIDLQLEDVIFGAKTSDACQIWWDELRKSK